MQILRHLKILEQKLLTKAATRHVLNTNMTVMIIGNVSFDTMPSIAGILQAHVKWEKDPIRLLL